MLSDAEIAESTKILPISQISEGLRIPEEMIQPYGKSMAKISHTYLRSIENQPKGKLIMVTAITPTPAGEGKTTTSIGLSLALNRLGKSSVVTLREPSLGPVFGVKGGAAGGGRSQVLPMDAINLHFTGDIHAVSASHNLLSAMIDAHLHHGNTLKLNPSSLFWPRVMDMNDRSLRQIVVGLGGGSNGLVREDQFMISVASEVMAILCLSKDLKDLKERLSKIMVGMNADKKPVFSSELKAQGAMAALLKHAIDPNLVQTTENTPAIIHGGPFANIAHGTNSIIATNMALRMCEYTITESGFAADLGAEKFMDFVTRVGQFWPDAIVLVATIRALKMHGGLSKKELDQEDLQALEKGYENLKVHIENLQKYGSRVVVALNRFPSDSPREIEWLVSRVQQSSASISLSEVWEKGSEGGIELAKKVIELSSQPPAEPKRLYNLDQTLEEKIEAIATEIYRAGKVNYLPEARKKIRIFSKEFGHLPIIMAKTQASLSDDQKKIGAPKGYTFTVRDLSVRSGAGFVVVYAGEIMTMPGLPKIPAATQIDIDEFGKISGLF